MSDSVKKHEEIKERELLPKNTKADKVYVRFGFSDQVMSLEDAMNPEKEICSCDSFVVGYEDENGRECHRDGTSLNTVFSNQIDMFDD